MEGCEQPTAGRTDEAPLGWKSIASSWPPCVASPWNSADVASGVSSSRQGGGSLGEKPMGMGTGIGNEKSKVKVKRRGRE
jgi:hypothetical protein